MKDEAGVRTIQEDLAGSPVWKARGRIGSYGLCRETSHNLVGSGFAFVVNFLCGLLSSSASVYTRDGSMRICSGLSFGALRPNGFPVPADHPFF